MSLGIRKWNDVNPMSEKPKIGGGTFTKKINGVKEGKP